MGLLSRLERWLSDDDESPFVCISCGAELDRNYRECPDCGKPYVAPRDDGAGESTQ